MTIETLAEHEGGRGYIEQAVEALETELKDLQDERDILEAAYQKGKRPLEVQIGALQAALTHQRHAQSALDAVGQNEAQGEPSTNGKRERLTDAAEEILRSEGAPLHYKELSDRLARRGVPIGAKNPGLYVIAYLRREPQRFCRDAKPGEYALVEWNLPDARPVAKVKKKGARRRKGAKRAKR